MERKRQHLRSFTRSLMLQVIREGSHVRSLREGKGKSRTNESELVGELNIMDVEIRKKRGRVLQTEMIDNDALGGGGDG